MLTIKLAQVVIVNPENFPPPKPVVKSSISVVPLFKQESFLRQKYEVERLSTSQIADQIFSARSTVAKHIKEFGIAEELTRSPSAGQVAFGKRKKGQQLIANASEEEIIQSIARLRSEGYSFRQIAAWLDAKGIKTKNRKGRWQAATVLKILRRNGSR